MAAYGVRYGLKADYPMVAQSYAEMRRGLAKKIGLGRKQGTKVAASTSRQANAKPKATRAACPSSEHLAQLGA